MTSGVRSDTVDLSLLNRRTFLGWASAVVLAGCHKKNGTIPPGSTDAVIGCSIQSPYDVLRIIKKSLEQSPDHLSSQAQQLIAQKDPEAIFRFVRDNIAVYPAPYFGNPETTMLFGVRGTLRGGA